MKQQTEPKGHKPERLSSPDRVTGRDTAPADSGEGKENEMIGKICVVRTYSAGVFIGEVAERNSKEVLLKNARRLWYWDGAASLSQLANEGVKRPNNCKFPAPVAEVLLTESIEIIPATEAAVASIEAVPEWKK